MRVAQTVKTKKDKNKGKDRYKYKNKDKYKDKDKNQQIESLCESAVVAAINTGDRCGLLRV